MQKVQRTFLKILAAGLILNLAAYAQSLADIARQSKEKQAAQDASAAKPKVITNADLGEGPEGKPELRNTEPRTGAMTRNADFRPPDHALSEQWRRQIREQENRVANLEARLDRINESVNENANAHGTYTRYQAIQQERAAQLQLQLDEQKRKLDVMQDEARRAGAR